MPRAKKAANGVLRCEGCGKPADFLVVMRDGSDVEITCLVCHSVAVVAQVAEFPEDGDVQAAAELTPAAVPFTDGSDTTSCDTCQNAAELVVLYLSGASPDVACTPCHVRTVLAGVEALNGQFQAVGEGMTPVATG